MTLEEMQTAVDALVPLMLAKGLVKPEAHIDIASQTQPLVTLRRPAPGSFYAGKWECFRGDDLAEALDKARAWIDALPTPEETYRKELLQLVAKAADYGKEHGIAADFVNPLTEAMKRLSESAITKEAV